MNENRKSDTNQLSNDVFSYVGYTIDQAESRITCTWRIGTELFTEILDFPKGGKWGTAAVEHAVKWLYLLAGVSYFKTRVPGTIDLGELSLNHEERVFLVDYYRNGLGEFEYRANNPQITQALASVRLVGGTQAVYTSGEQLKPRERRPLVPFGGGLDSIVSVEMLKSIDSVPTLFVVSRPADRFDAIERPATHTGLAICRATRLIDPKVLESDARGYFNGHVPVTAIISAMALVVAALFDHDSVVMSNEWSASSPTIEASDGRSFNHQYSKSWDFEKSFAAIVALVSDMPEYFSLLRRRSELWIAKYFSDNCGRYIHDFCSCNRAFRIDAANRSVGWCGECDKCAFIDLILSPYLAASSLRGVFNGREPLEQPEMAPKFERLVGIVSDSKPWECVGDVRECKVALALAAQRADREGNPILHELSRRLGAIPTESSLLSPRGEDGVPDRYAR